MWEHREHQLRPAAALVSVVRWLFSSQLGDPSSCGAEACPCFPHSSPSFSLCETETEKGERQESRALPQGLDSTIGQARCARRAQGGTAKMGLGCHWGPSCSSPAHEAQ